MRRAAPRGQMRWSRWCARIVPSRTPRRPGLFVAGAEIDWPAVLSGAAAARVELPTYAFHRQPYWLSRWPETAVAAAILTAVSATRLATARRYRCSSEPVGYLSDRLLLCYRYRNRIRPRVRSYGLSSTSTRSYGMILM
jgi:hypothetical protein